MTLEAVKRGAVSPGPVAAEMLGTGRHEAGHTRGKGRRPARGSLARDRPQLGGGLELTCAAPCAGNGRRNPSCFLRFNFQKGREEHQRTPNPALRRRSRLTQLLQESCFSSTSAEARQGTWPQMAVTQRFQIKNHKKKKTAPPGGSVQSWPWGSQRDLLVTTVLPCVCSPHRAIFTQT